MGKSFLVVISMLMIIGSIVGLSLQNRDHIKQLQLCGEMQSALQAVIGDPYVTDERLAEVLTNFNVKYPHIVHAQAFLESGGFSSELFLRNKNMFGMKHPTVRVTTSLGEVGGYAYYPSWIDSVVDYALWYQTYASKCSNEEEVYKLLDKIYAEHPDYSGMVRENAKLFKIEFYQTVVYSGI